MNDLRTTAEQALDALEELNGWQSLAPPLVSQAARRTAVNLRAALEQPEQEPVAYLYHDAKSAHDANPLAHSTLLVHATERRPECRNETPLYTHPPRREWRGLTEEEINEATFHADERMNTHLEFARAIEAALKEKNG